MNTQLDRSEYKSEQGIARWWEKDGAWHIALPCPEVVDGLRTGGFRWTATPYNRREDAVAAIEQ